LKENFEQLFFENPTNQNVIMEVTNNNNNNNNNMNENFPLTLGNIVIENDNNRRKEEQKVEKQE
jgi:hypothetical protein